MEIKSLVSKLEEWANDRGLLDANSEVQYTKILEELGETSNALNKNYHSELVDSIGDLQVTLIIFSRQVGIDVEEAIKLAELIKHKPVNTPQECLMSLTEKLGNISNSYRKSNFSSLRLSIGEAMYKVRCFAELVNLDSTKCLEKAYDVISERKGKLVNGTFIKEDDLR